MQELIKKVEDWSDSKGIGDFNYDYPFAQLDKIKEEFDELWKAFDDCLAVENEEKEVFEESHHEVLMELGDLLVTTIVFAHQNGYDLEECLEMAYNKISKRNGKLVNGQFVKDE